MSQQSDDFGKLNVSETISHIHDNLESILSETEIFLTLPIDYIKQNMSHEDYIKYLALREKTIHVLNLLEVFVYDTHEDATHCFECGETECNIVTKRINGQEVETVNGDIELWVNNGKIHHIFICDECLRRKRNQ